jgi:hypothetical protein
MKRRRLLAIGIPLAVNSLLSWTILPIAVPPFGGYSIAQLVEVLLWQGIGTVGWPLGLLGAFLSLIFKADAVSLGALLLMLVYPSMLLLFVLALISKTLHRWQIILLHLLLTFSFGAVWYHVLNGYGFMAG